MLTCDDVRVELALDPQTNDGDVLSHLKSCSHCEAYRRTMDSLDDVLAKELRWEVPAALTAQLLSIAAMPQALMRPAPKRWVVTLVYSAAAALVAISLLVVFQFLGVLSAQIGLGDLLNEAIAFPARMMQQLSQSLPESRYAIDLFLRVRDQLIWMLMVAILWVALDRWSPRNTWNRPTT
jgi:predicted anti-sigma-YlaC factor YlaD